MWNLKVYFEIWNSVNATHTHLHTYWCHAVCTCVFVCACVSTGYELPRVYLMPNIFSIAKPKSKGRKHFVNTTVFVETLKSK